MNKKTKLKNLLALSILLFVIDTKAEELPFQVGDTIGFMPARSDRMGIKSAIVKNIIGRWIFVEAKGGGSEWNCWYNLDQIQNFWIEKRGKKEGDQSQK
jgi:hypothetical protein